MYKQEKTNTACVKKLDKKWQGRKVRHFLPLVKFNHSKGEMTLYSKGVHIDFFNTFFMFLQKKKR
jgi:hypothetical protein